MCVCKFQGSVCFQNPSVSIVNGDVIRLKAIVFLLIIFIAILTNIKHVSIDNAKLIQSKTTKINLLFS